MLGIDLEKVSRFETWSDKDFERVFSKAEIEYANKFKNKFSHFCGFYCVKEALVKALDNKKLKYNQIEVLHTNSGKPYLNLNKYLTNILKKQNLSKIEISISHSLDYAIAVVELK